MLRIQGRLQVALELVFKLTRFRGVGKRAMAKGASRKDVRSASVLCCSRMRDSFRHLELNSGEEEVLGEHVDDLPGRMVFQPLPKTPVSVSPRHADVQDVVKVVDDLDAWGIGYAGPQYFGEATRL